MEEKHQCEWKFDTIIKLEVKSPSFYTYKEVAVYSCNCGKTKKISVTNEDCS